MHYIKQLVAAYPTIREVWLYGSRANGTERIDSDWDYLAYADKSTLDRLALDVRFDREDVDLMIVVDGNRFLKPWLCAGGPRKEGTLLEEVGLGGLEWTRESKTVASYTATKEDQRRPGGTEVLRRRAHRVYPFA